MRTRIRLVTVAVLALAGFAALAGLTTVDRGPHAVALEQPITTDVATPESGPFVESEVIETPFTMAGFTWEGKAPDAVWYRVGDAAGWSGWNEMPIEAGEEPDPGTTEYERYRAGTDAVFVGEQDRIQFRFAGSAPIDGRAALVVQKHLGADSLQRWLQSEGFMVERVASKAGFRLLTVARR